MFDKTFDPWKHKSFSEMPCNDSEIEILCLFKMVFTEACRVEKSNHLKEVSYNRYAFWYKFVVKKPH